MNGRAFRGVLTVQSNGKSLQVVDTVGLESYVKGVVASEMPQAWPEAALELRRSLRAPTPWPTGSREAR